MKNISREDSTDSSKWDLLMLILWSLKILIMNLCLAHISDFLLSSLLESMLGMYSKVFLYGVKRWYTTRRVYWEFQFLGGIYKDDYSQLMEHENIMMSVKKVLGINQKRVENVNDRNISGATGSRWDAWGIDFGKTARGDLESRMDGKVLVFCTLENFCGAWVNKWRKRKWKMDKKRV